MKISSKDTLFNQPVLKIREVLRLAMHERLTGRTEAELNEKVVKILNQSVTEAKNVLTQLVKHGYLEKNIKYKHSLSPTIKGRQLGNAKAIAPISREKADKLLTELIERAKAINENNELVYYVEYLKVFGSYLSNSDTLGDLDIGFKLSAKYKGEEFTIYNQKRIEYALNNGRNFRNIVEELTWSYQEVVLLLKARQRSLSLHEEGADQVLELTKTKVVYQYDNPITK